MRSVHFDWRKLSMALAVGGALVLGAIPADAGQWIRDQRQPAGAYPDSQRKTYDVYIPDGIAPGASAPMVMVLHGCNQTQRNMVNESGFVQRADEHKFIAVFPFIDEYTRLGRAPNCWGFWLGAHQKDTGGEPRDLVRIGQAVEEMAKARGAGVDPQRRFVIGLSSGAGMSVVLATVFSEYFTAAAALAGLPYTETDGAVTWFCGGSPRTKPVSSVVAAMRREQRTPEEQRLVPLMVIASRNDCTVNFRNATNLRDSWIERYGAAPNPVETRTESPDGIATTIARHVNAAGETVVETVFYDGPPGRTGKGHYWVGDGEGEFALPQGPSASRLAWAFFDRVAAGPVRGAINPPMVVDTSPDAATVTVTGTAQAVAGVASVTVGLESGGAVRDVPAQGTETWTAVFEGVPRNASYTPRAAIIDRAGMTRTIVGAPFDVGTPPPPPAPPLEEATASLNDHLIAQRIRVYGQGCAAPFELGACDASYLTLLQAQGYNPLATVPLFAAPGSNTWYADRAAVPRN